MLRAARFKPELGPVPSTLIATGQEEWAKDRSWFTELYMAPCGWKTYFLLQTGPITEIEHNGCTEWIFAAKVRRLVPFWQATLQISNTQVEFINK